MSTPIALPLTGAAATRAALEAKLSIARLRAQHAPTAAQRAAEAERAAVYAERLASLAGPPA